MNRQKLSTGEAVKVISTEKKTDHPAEIESVQLPDVIGGFVFGKQYGELILLGEQGKIRHYQWGETYREIISLPGAGSGTLINDVIAAPDGSIFLGVLMEYFFDKEKQNGLPGSMWNLTGEGSLVQLEKDAGNIPNGMAFSPDLSKFYFAVTDHHCIYEYNYPEMKEKKKISLGYCPDGITVDQNGRIWVADCGKHICCHAPDGTLLKKYYFPGIWGITSVIIGDGKLYFTTMNHQKDPAYPMGKVYELEIGEPGIPEFRFSFC
jgi:sugar lactone lactonase YvrE